ncbi:cytochrome P450 CYP749A22-like [Andrographis paniculata]|uniref:cytochrome P450 CYP749A22-like n=1 Tax=Andrographis paniculata TaxID=175694 RepID=UPI0021E8D8B5|nr:cytochrome P450 CYP749A22-like [Andrographis paniculata]
MFLSLLLLLPTLLVLLRFINNLVWNPIRVQLMMRSQGISGPSYKFIHGTTKESMRLKLEGMNRPMEMSHDIFPQAQPSFYAWMNLYGANFLTWNGPRPHLVITEPELAKEILTNKGGDFPKIKLDGIAEKLVGDGLFTAEGTKWLKLRKLANSAFYAESLKAMTPAMVASVETMLGNWKQSEGKEIEVSQEFRVLSSEVISRTAFGSSYLEGKNIFDMMAKLGMLIFKNADRVRFPVIDKVWKLKDDIESDRIERSLRASVKEIVKKREAKVKSGEEANFGTDFLGLLLRAHHNIVDEESTISVDNIIDECKVFFLAGHETTSSLLSWTFLLLAIHEDWQDKARAEVVDVFGDGNPIAEGLPKLKIASMVVNEVLRLYAPVVSLVRRVKSKARAGKYEFPAGMELHIPTLALHRNAKIWGEDAHLFKPDRFADGIAKATRNNPTAFLPFGYGPRTCVGLNFASNEVKIAMSMVLQRYKFTLAPTYVHSPITILTTQPRNGVQIVLRKV